MEIGGGAYRGMRSTALLLEFAVYTVCVALTGMWTYKVFVTKKVFARMAKGGNIFKVLQDDYYCILVLLVAAASYAVAFAMDSSLGSHHMLGHWSDLSAKGRMIFSYEAIIFAMVSCLILGRQSRTEIVVRKVLLCRSFGPCCHYSKKPIRTHSRTNQHR